MRHSLASVLAVLLLVAPAAAWAQLKNVYLNGVRINDVQGLRDLKMERVTVRFDERGDLHIDAPGYKIDLVDPSGGAKGTGTGDTASRPQPGTEEGTGQLTRKYFLVTEQTAPGMTDYEIDVFVNAKWIRKLRNNEEQIYSDITKHLQPGKNTITFNARKLESKARRSQSPEHVFRVIVGEGNVGGDTVLIDRPVVDFRRTAADTDDVSRDFTFTTR